VFPRNSHLSTQYEEILGRTNDHYASELSRTQGQARRQELKSEQDQAISTILRAREKERMKNVYMGKIGLFIAPVFEPIGIDWRGSVALLTGFVAKEVVVSSLGILYAIEGEDNQTALLSKALLDSGMTPLSALSMMVFVLLYIPCLATVFIIRRETGSVKWAIFNIGYTTVVAWCTSFCVYRAGLFFFAG